MLQPLHRIALPAARAHLLGMLSAGGWRLRRLRGGRLIVGAEGGPGGDGERAAITAILKVAFMFSPFGSMTVEISPLKVRNWQDAVPQRRLHRGRHALGSSHAHPLILQRLQSACHSRSSADFGGARGMGDLPAVAFGEGRVCPCSWRASTGKMPVPRLRAPDAAVNRGMCPWFPQERNLLRPGNPPLSHFMIEVSGLTKCHGGFTAVRDLSCAVQAGEVMGLLGPTGRHDHDASLLHRGLPPAHATVRIGGIDLAADPIGAKRQLAFFPDEPRLFDTSPSGSTCFCCAPLWGRGFRRARAGPPRRARDRGQEDLCPEIVAA